MASEPGWKRNVCDGSSEHCVQTAFVKEGDEKAEGMWHDRTYVTKDGETMHYFLCQSCTEEYDAIIGSHDMTVNKFIKVRGV